MLANCRTLAQLHLRVAIRSMTSASANNLFTEVVKDGTTALTIGAPGPRHLEKVATFLAKASEHNQKQGRNEVYDYLQYGPKPGSQRFRQQLAAFLADGYGSPVDSESLVVTSGATFGLLLAGSVLFRNGYSAIVEDPTYFIAINILKGELGMNVVAVPTDANDGVDLEILEKRLQEEKSRFDPEPTNERPFSSMIYLIPTYHNPLSFCLSPEKCKAVIQLARKYNALVFCDDVYNLLHFDASKSHAPPRLLTYDNPSDPDFTGGNVLSNGTFSKILSPGLRLGWIEAGPKIINLIKNNNITWSAGSSNQYSSEIVASALELGEEQKYLKSLNEEYRSSVSAFCNALEEHLPKSCQFTKPKGGYFIWITMPEGASGAAVAKQALEQEKIRMLPGNICSATGSHTNCLRVSFSHYPQDVLVKSAKQIAGVINQHLNSL